MSFLLSFFHWTVCLTQVIWTHTEIDVPVYHDLEDYIEIPTATLYIDGKVMSDEPSYVRDGVNRTFLSTVVTSYVKTYYIYFEAYFEKYNINEKQLIQINVIDEIDPMITYIPTYTIDVYSEPPDFYQSLIYEDNYDEVEDLTIDVDDQLVNYDRVGTYEVIYYITDQSGNDNLYRKQISIIDRISPDIKLLKPIKIDVHTQLDIYDFIEVSDNYYSNINVHVIGDEEPFTKIGFYEITVLAVDLSKNITQETYMLEVLDLSPPTLILTSYPKPIAVNTDFDLEDCYSYILALSDNYDELEMLDIHIIFDIDIKRVGTYQIYYDISDQSGNNINETLSIEVKDFTEPSINISEPLIFEVYSQQPILKNYFSVTDNYCELSSVDIDIHTTLNMNQIGVYELIITAIDCYENEAILETIIEVVDLIPPEIIQVQEIILTDFKYKDLSIYFNATDQYDLDHTRIEIDDDHVDYETVGNYELTVYAYDQSQNEKKLITEVLVVDITPPILKLKETEIYIDIGKEQLDFMIYIDSVSDDYTEVTVNDLIINNEVNTNYLGKYDVVFTLVDSSLNQSTQILEVFVADREPPTMKGYTLYVDMYDTIDLMEGIYVEDNVEIYQVYTSIDYIDTSYPGSYKVKYVAVDTSGNQRELSRMIYISEIEQAFTIKDFTPIIVICLMCTSILYYLYKKL